MVIVPSSAVETMGLGGLAGMTALGKDPPPRARHRAGTARPAIRAAMPRPHETAASRIGFVDPESVISAKTLCRRCRFRVTARHGVCYREISMNPADTAWLLVATALVLLMTPALGFFYGGLVRSKNALNTMMMSFGALGFVGIGWALARLLARVLGRRDRGSAASGTRCCAGVDLAPQGTMPHVLFFSYQGTFAIITAALISGRDRRADALRALPRVPHRSGRSSSTRRSRTGCGAAGCSRGSARSTSPAAPSCTSTRRRRRSSRRWVLGPRKDHARQAMLPHNVPFTLLGAGCSGSAGSGSTRAARSRANPSAALAFTNTLFAPVATLVVWTLLDLAPRRQGDRGRRGHGDRRRPRRRDAGGRASSARSRAILLGARRRVPELLRAPLARADPPRRLARRRRRARRRRHGRRAPDGRPRAEVLERRRRTASSSATRASSRSRRSPSLVAVVFSRRDDLRHPASSIGAFVAAPGDVARGRARPGRHPARRGGVRARRGRDPRAAGSRDAGRRVRRAPAARQRRRRRVLKLVVAIVRPGQAERRPRVALPRRRARPDDPARAGPRRRDRARRDVPRHDREDGALREGAARDRRLRPLRRAHRRRDPPRRAHRRGRRRKGLRAAGREGLPDPDRRGGPGRGHAASTDPGTPVARAGAAGRSTLDFLPVQNRSSSRRRGASALRRLRSSSRSSVASRRGPCSAPLSLDEKIGQLFVYRVDGALHERGSRPEYRELVHQVRDNHVGGDPLVPLLRRLRDGVPEPQAAGARARRPAPRRGGPRGRARDALPRHDLLALADGGRRRPATRRSPSGRGASSRRRRARSA